MLSLILTPSGMSICTHLHSHACSGTHALCALTMEVEEREEQCFLTMEDAEDSATGLPKRACFVESSAERTWQLVTLGKRKKQSQCTKEAKRARRKRESAKEKCTLRRVFTSHAGINYTHFHVRFNRSPSWAQTICDTCSTWPINVHICTCTARREASCACMLASFPGSPTPELWR